MVRAGSSTARAEVCRLDCGEGPGSRGMGAKIAGQTWDRTATPPLRIFPPVLILGGLQSWVRIEVFSEPILGTAGADLQAARPSGPGRRLLSPAFR
jgi:hypothetical protein